MMGSEIDDIIDEFVLNLFLQTDQERLEKSLRGSDSVPDNVE